MADQKNEPVGSDNVHPFRKKDTDELHAKLDQYTGKLVNWAKKNPAALIAVGAGVLGGLALTYFLFRRPSSITESVGAIRGFLHDKLGDLKGSSGDTGPVVH